MIRQFSYLDVPGSQRAQFAKKAREQIRATLTGNFVTPEQREYLNARLMRIDAWERGAIDVPKG